MNDRVYKCAKLLAKQSKLVQKEFVINRRVDISHLKEFCTVKVSTARRSGHTTAIVKIALESVQKKKNVLVLSHNQHMSRAICGQAINEVIPEMVNYTSHRLRTESNTIWFDSRGNNYDRFKGPQIDVVLVDCATFWSPNKIDEMYKIVAPSMMFVKYPIIYLFE